MANSPARAGVDVGSVIADTYRIEALIGRGGMGAVFLASHARLPGKQVAIKLLHAELHDDEVMARFRREAEIASRLGHPNIVAVHDFNIMADGTPYLVLEYLRGESLAQRLVHGALPVDQALSILRQIGSALAVAHREGIVHRDLKPQNIFLVPTEVDGKSVEIAKVLDFGISKIRGSTTVQTQDSALLGTPQYMAPEQALGQHANVDERTDVFALGAIVYEMLAGRPAFQGASIPEVVFKVVYEQPAPLDARIDPAIAGAVMRAMAKAQDQRFPTVGAFVEALTGQPLATYRGPAIALPGTGPGSGNRTPVTSPDALAHTMGSGDHGPLDATLAPPAAASVLASAPTVDSQARPPVVVAPAAPVAATSAPPPPARRSKALWLVALGCIAATVAVMYVVMRKDAPVRGEAGASTTATRTTASATTVASTGSASTQAAGVDRTPSAGSADVPPSAGSAGSADPPPSTGSASSTGSADASPSAGSADAPPPSAGSADAPRAPTTTRPTPPKPSRPPRPVEDEPDDADTAALRQRLASAEAAARSDDLVRAERLASSVINSQTKNRRLRAAAHAVKGAIACARHNLSAARGELREIDKLGGFGPLRRRMLHSCHAVGMLKDIPR